MIETLKKTFSILKLRKNPDYVASVKKRKDGWIEEEWYTNELALPFWWNDNCHALLEQKVIGGKGFVKYCLKCKSKIPDTGCTHNKL